jgi:hypothetical protein
MATVIRILEVTLELVVLAISTAIAAFAPRVAGAAR